MKILRNAAEAPSGVISYTKDGQAEKDYPNNNLLDAYRLYEDYLSWRRNGGKVDVIGKNGENWQRTCCHHLVWDVFLPYVQHKNLFHELVAERLAIKFSSRGRFGRLMENVLPGFRNSASNGITFLLNIMVVVKNFIIASMDHNDAVNICLENDFRMKPLELDLKNKNIKFTRFIKGTKKGFIRSLFKKHYYFLFEYKNRDKIQKKLIQTNSNFVIFEYAEISANNLIKINQFQYSIYMLLSLLLRKVKIVFGSDDTKYSYPLLYAFQNRDACCVGLQHGAYNAILYEYTKNVARDYRWFDKIIVWGTYWRDILLESGNTMPTESFVLGSNKHNLRYHKKELLGNKSVIMFYEQWTEMSKVGMFAKGFIENGFMVYYKIRPDVGREDQIKSLALSDTCLAKIVIIEDAQAELMDKIDVVVGVGTSLIFELMPFGKMVWVLDIDQGYIYLESLVENGYARLLQEKDLCNLESCYLEDMEKEFNQDYSILDQGRNNAEVLLEIYQHEKLLKAEL